MEKRNYTIVMKNGFEVKVNMTEKEVFEVMKLNNQNKTMELVLNNKKFQIKYSSITAVVANFAANYNLNIDREAMNIVLKNGVEIAVRLSEVEAEYNAALNMDLNNPYGTIFNDDTSNMITVIRNGQIEKIMA